jgi:membrane-associated phospholipid phosphatase
MARYLCDTIVPMLMILVMQEPLLYPTDRPWTARLRRALDFWVRAALAITIAVTLSQTGKAYEVWPGLPGFPSGHATMASALATIIVLHRGPAWAFLAVPLALLMPPALYFNQAHTPIESLAGLLLGPIVVLPVWWLTRRYA